MSISKKSFIGAALGTMIEYYDYGLFFIFLPILSPLFFPAATLYQSLVKGYFILMIAMLARPLGGVLFGYLGDTCGRRKALLTSMYGIALATLAIGIMPTYHVWGIWATILIVFCKSVQLFCFGGEYNGAGIYVVEHAEKHNESFTGSLLTAMMLSGSFLSSLMAVLFTASFMPAWSWRIAFILGSLIGVFGIFFRKNLSESPVFEAADLTTQNMRNLLREFPRELSAGFFIGGFATMLYTTVITFINPVLMAKGVITSHQLMISQTSLILIAVIALILSGKIADKYTPKKIMQWSIGILFMMTYPLLLLIDSGHLVFVAMAILIIINEMLLAPSNAYLKNLFPVQYRYRGISLSFCLGMSIIGGLTPVIENFFYHLTGHFQAISIWLIFVGLGTYLSMYYAQKKQKFLLPSLGMEL
jgi:MFS transporter, MHS family, proline/betaine transporter